MARKHNNIILLIIIFNIGPVGRWFYYFVEKCLIGWFGVRINLFISYGINNKYSYDYCRFGDDLIINNIVDDPG